MKKLKIKPLADRILVESDKAEEKTSSGIYIPDTAQKKPKRGTILAVGNGKKDEPMELKIGDKVIYSDYAGNEIEIEEEKYLVLRQSDVMAILEG